MSKLSSLFLSTLALACIALTPACGPEDEDFDTPAVQEELQSEEDSTTAYTQKKKPGTGQFCGGIAGIQCPEGFTCVDDPRDSCNPRTGGADCGGICKASKPRKCDCNDPTRHYISRDPEECAAILFLCPEGETPFFNDCGCGCETETQP